MKKKLLWILVITVLFAIVVYIFYNNRTEKSCSPNLYCMEVKYRN